MENIGFTLKELQKEIKEINLLCTKEMQNYFGETFENGVFLFEKGDLYKTLMTKIENKLYLIPISKYFFNNKSSNYYVYINEAKLIGINDLEKIQKYYTVLEDQEKNGYMSMEGITNINMTLRELNETLEIKEHKGFYREEISEKEMCTLFGSFFKEHIFFLKNNHKKLVIKIKNEMYVMPIDYQKEDEPPYYYIWFEKMQLIEAEEDEILKQIFVHRKEQKKVLEEVLESQKVRLLFMNK